MARKTNTPSDLVLLCRVCSQRMDKHSDKDLIICFETNTGIRTAGWTKLSDATRDFVRLGQVKKWGQPTGNTGYVTFTLTDGRQLEYLYEMDTIVIGLIRDYIKNWAKQPALSSLNKKTEEQKDAPENS